MNLMRTLLIYLSATLALAVQNAAAPTETPTPSPAPTAVVETAETPGPAGETATAAVTPAEQTGPAEKITPLPVPLITPNMKGYHNLAMGSRGKEVRKLQEKLIEMGYLPEGSADGAYGRQTYNAVKKFQYYNGLTADGIAGRKTQTNLFENPEAAPNPDVKGAAEIATPEVTEAPAETPAPETIPTETETPEVTAEPEITEAPETAAPETEAPETDEPEATAEPETTEVPETEAPETEAPETEAPETEEPEVTAEPEVTEPAETETPETEAPEATAEPEEDIPDIIENVDLDAEVYEEISGMVALNEGDGPLEFVRMEDGVPVIARPRLSQNGAKIRISLEDLCECVEKWQLTDDGVGSVVLEAAGYTLVLYNEDKGCSATLDGREIPMKDEDYDFITEGHYINAEFLATALKGEAVWDQEENTLMLRIRDKEAVESAD